jgi:transposase
MAKARTLVGLDVHASKVVAAMLDAETGELRFSKLAGGNEATLTLCARLEPPVRATYEAGPTGFGLARALTAAGTECVVAAPGKIPRGAQDRVKTDRKDAELLVRLLLAGSLSVVAVPPASFEAARDLARA